MCIVRAQTRQCQGAVAGGMCVCVWGGDAKKVNFCFFCCFTKFNCFVRVMSIIHQQDWISQRVPCCCLGHKAPFKPLGAYVITRPTFLGQRNAVEVVSVFLIQPKPIIDSQNTLFVEIFIVEDLLSTEHKSQLQDRPICPNTLDCRDKFKVLALQLHMVTLFL
jgi:hypothetical protein